MRSMLGLLAAFTLSTSAAATAVACGSTSNQTTPDVFKWNDVINGENGKTASDFFEYLLKNPDLGIGQTLYKDIVDYISLSILKTNAIFDSDYQFAKLSVENQIANIENSLKAKYGRSWEKHWQDFLKDPAQGGDGKTGSYQRYFDILLKSKANTIVSQYYVGDNYHNYQYYNSTEISIWLNDIYNYQIRNKHQSLVNYRLDGVYGNKLWIVAKSVKDDDVDDTTDPFPNLRATIEKAPSASSISLNYKVAKTKDDTPLEDGDNYLIDPSNTIKGLLSNQQTKIAQVWMKNQGPIWTRQIVIPFNDNDKNNALKTSITAEKFSDRKTTLVNVINTIKTDGFEAALKSQGDIKNITSSAETGDLGLVTLNSDTNNVKASFLYYLYRYITSNQGVGQNNNTTIPYQLSEYKPDGGSDINLTALINTINRTRTTDGSQQTSDYHDLVWMTDKDSKKKYSGTDNNGKSDNKVAIFIDADGIHFIQTPGITYTSTVSTEPIQTTITNYTQLISDSSKTATWDDVKNLSDRPGGLTNTPYLNFLQTQYLLWNTNNETTYFDLNSSLKNFTSGSNDIASNAWWDYILYFNKNIDNIHWNLPTVLNTNVSASQGKIDTFILLMKNWFTTTFDTRWNTLQGTNLDTLITNINQLNTTWDNDPDMKENGPPARLNAEDIKIYLDQVAGQTIWWYDPNSIQN
ncbi:MAG: hypothetical protein REH79_03255 [Spiroplasma sp.]|nr:hypothetical protein [Spiroplasma sp.]